MSASRRHFRRTDAPDLVTPATPGPSAASTPTALVKAKVERLPFILLALAGANLSLVHFVSLTELPSLLGSNELVALIVLAAYFLGLSVGYLVSDKLGRGHLMAVGVATLLLHATLPFSARWFSGVMWRIGLEGNTPPFIFLLVMLGITPFYAVFLPRLIDTMDAPPPPPAMGGHHSRLVALYATEIAGGLAGLALSVALTPARMSLILTAHLSGIVALCLLSTRAVGPKRLLAILFVPLPIAYLFVYPALDRASLEYFYQYRRGFKEVHFLASEFSPYQRVDIFEATKRNGSATYLYLNGNLLYGSTSLNQHNLFVSILPNLLIGHPSRALVVAGGSLDAARYLAPRVGHLNVVEIDETVTRLARRHIQDPRGGFPDNWDLAIDDGKHFLGNWDGPPFDVISIDVPVPTYLQTAMLYSDRFFALARRKLAPGGVLSLSLAGSYDDEENDDSFSSHVSQRIMAGLLKSFQHVTVVRTEEGDFAWASDAAPAFDLEAIQATLRSFLDADDAHERFGRPQALAHLRLLDDVLVRARAVGFLPIGEADMQIVLRLSLNKLRERFYEPANR